VYYADPETETLIAVLSSWLKLYAVRLTITNPPRVPAGARRGSLY